MKRVVIAIIGLICLSNVEVFAYDSGDFQVWHTENQSFKISEKSNISVEEEFRWGDDAGDFYYHHYDVGFERELSDHFKISLNYRQVYEKKKGDFLQENRPHFDATVKHDLIGIKLEDRSRFEFRHFDSKEDSWRYRNKITLKLPWKFTGFKIQPYIANEAFLELNTGILSRDRIYSGFIFNINKTMSSEIYYLWQNSKSSGDWVVANVLGTKIKLKF